MDFNEGLALLGLANATREELIFDLVRDVYACIDKGYLSDSGEVLSTSNRVCCEDRYGAFHMALGHLKIRCDKIGSGQPFRRIVGELRELYDPAKKSKLSIVMQNMYQHSMPASEGVVPTARETS